MPYRIFAADDWGFSPGVNAGILELAKLGQLRSVSLVANSAHLLHRLGELLTFAEGGLEFSLHLNFTYGGPLATEVASLTESHNNQFVTHKRLLWRAFTGRISESDVRSEFEAQLRRLRGLAIPVTGVDGHHHVHLIPPLTAMIQRLAAENGLRRFRLMVDGQHLASRLQTTFCSKSRADLIYENCGYLRPKNLKSAGHYLEKISAGQTLLVHPALYDDFAGAGMTDSLRADRVHELRKILEFSRRLHA